MYIEKISIKNFRNYKTLECEFDPRVNIIIGDNAQGKTNLIEAVYLCSFARSFRTRREFEMVQFDEIQADIISDIISYDERHRIEIRIRKEGKNVKADGKNISKMQELLDKAYVVIFSPEDLRLVKDSPDKRRKFIDQELSKLKPSYYESLYSYKKILKQRNAYLKEDDIQIDILSVWDDQLALYGMDVMKKRAEFIKRLEKISARIHSNITKGKERLSIEYEPDVNENEDFLSIIDHAKDIKSGNTRRGPHRDDIKICIDGIDIRNYGSQGQQRTAALSLKLAELEIIEEITGDKAILLLDDVLSELDQGRQEYLINSFEGLQVFITAAEISDDVYERLNKGKTFIVEKGKVIDKI